MNSGDLIRKRTDGVERALRVERLEPRLLLACSVRVRADTACVRGDRDDNFVTVDDLGNGTVTVDCDGAGGTFVGVEVVVVRTRGGDDEFLDALLDNVIWDIDVFADLGSGDDIATVDMSGFEVSADVEIGTCFRGAAVKNV